MGRQALDRIALGPELLLGLRPQLVGVRQGVAAEAVGQALEHRGTFAGAGPLDRALGRTANRQHIHAVDLFAGHAEGGRLTPDLRIAGGAVVVHADGPLVVLDHEDDRQLPERRHVQALVELTDVAGAVAEEGRGHSVAAGVAQGVALVAAGEGRTQGHGNALTDEGITTQQVVLLGEEVHGAATALAAAGLLTEELAHHLTGRHAAAQGVDVIAIGAAEPVVLHLHRLDHPRAHGLLAVVEVNKAEHLSAVVHLGALVFEAPAEGHVAVQHQALIPRHRCRRGGIEVHQPLGVQADLIDIGGAGGSTTGGDALSKIGLCHG